MKLKFKPHTIIMLVGPTESGKSTFAKEILVPGLRYTDESKNFNMNVQYISSDEIRKDLLGYDYDKHDNIMLESSELAFDMMYKKIDLVTSFPINAEFVVLDTTGLSEQFRKDIRDIAEKNNYNIDVVVFNYKDMKDYYGDNRNKKLIVNHVTRLRREVLKELRSSDYNNIYSIKKRDFFKEIENIDFFDPFMERIINKNYVIEIEGLENYLGHYLDNNYEYTIISDVHEEVDALKELLLKKKFLLEGNKIIGNERNENARIVLVGDWIDKGNRTKEIIEFLLDNDEYFYLVKGNHENFVYKYLKGEIIDGIVSNELIENQFTSIKHLITNEELKNKFFSLVEKSKVFYAFKGITSNSFYVTHAPCENKYIGKLDKLSIKSQMRFSYDRSEDLENQLSFLRKEGVFNCPYHVFGHVATKEGFRILNKLSIDTGAVYGNKLTSVSFGSNKVFYYSVSVNKELVEVLPLIFKAKAKTVNLKDLDRDDIKKLKYVSKNKINYISGTMSPADKDLEKGILESLDKGLDYFKKSGVGKVILQHKYMGSRCNIYLNKDVENSFAVSRNGYIIRKIDLSDVFEKLAKKHGKYMEEKGIQILELDGELLPWRALGEGLIENSFKPVEISVGKEIDLLRKYNFESSFEKLNNNYEQSDFKADRNIINKSELLKKYGNRDYANFKNIENYKNIPLDNSEAMWEIFKEQIELFGVDSEVDYSAFNILKIIYEDGREETLDGNAEDVFNLISEDDYVIVDLNNENEWEKAREFYEETTVNKKMEGVVIKPLVEKEGVLPFMKVRNERYLTIVYGYDYKLPHKYKKLLNEKSITNKVRTSLKEHELGKEMLRIPLSDINENNAEYKQIVANMLFEVKRESEIDPRL